MGVCVFVPFCSALIFLFRSTYVRLNLFRQNIIHVLVAVPSDKLIPADREHKPPPRRLTSTQSDPGFESRFPD